MAEMVEEINATYEELEDLERDFEDVETEIIRKQHALTKPLYEKREKVVAKIPNFWPLVFEQAPQEVDQWIQPSDSAVLLTALKQLTVTHLEMDDASRGDPRSIAIRMEFGENDYFEDAVLEKRFWYRRSADGKAGLVSEPVPIKWKAGKDLTNGMLDLAVKIWRQDQKAAKAANGDAKSKKKRNKTTTKPADWTADQKALRKKIETMGLGGVSFFCWFGYRGDDISEEESRAATAEERKRRAERAAGKAPETKGEAEGDDDAADEDEDEEDDDDPYALEIFPDGDELAVAISEDLWPSAIRYFTQAQEVDAISDLDFEEDDDDMEEDGEQGADGQDDDDEAPPLKKVKV
ncbi:nucleosome assembly protein [Xylariaceae sp. FL0804]|nr:nucleosome assembly protein [Xylariaceae sp. FL0804]